MLDDLLGLDGLPTELLEDPLTFLETVLEGHLPPTRSGRKVGSRKLVQIALAIIDMMRELPEAVQSAVRAWADVHRRMLVGMTFDDYEDADLSELLFPDDLPLAMTGFSMMIALTLMRWPERADGMPLPPEFEDPEVYDDVLSSGRPCPTAPLLRRKASDRPRPCSPKPNWPTCWPRWVRSSSSLPTSPRRKRSTWLTRG
jgi:hypothetical protein